MSKLLTKQALWLPRNVGETNVAKFIKYVNRKHDLKLQTYHDLHQWSSNPASLSDFWRDTYIFLELAHPGAKEVGAALESHVRLFKIPAMNRELIKWFTD